VKTYSQKLNQKWFLVVFCILVGGLYSLKTIRLQTELFPIFPKDLLAVQGLKTYQEKFTSSQEVFIVFEAPISHERSISIESLKKDLSQLDDVQSVNVVGENNPDFLFKAMTWAIVHLPPSQFTEFQNIFKKESLERRLEMEQKRLYGSIDSEQLIRFKMDPFGVITWLQAKVGYQIGVPAPSTGDSNQLSILTIRAKQPLRTFEQSQLFVKNLRKTVRANVPSDQKYYLTGGPAFVSETSLQMRRDMYFMISIATILVSVAFFLFYRSILPLISILLVQALSLLMGLISARLIFNELNVLSIAFAAILLGVSMDYCILVYHFYSSRGNSEEWKTLKKGIWLSALTTAASFSILAFSSFPGLKQLSLLVSVGLLVTAWMAVDLLPGLLSKFQLTSPEWLEKFSDKLSSWMSAYQIRLRWFSLVFIIFICIWAATSKYPYFNGNLDQLHPSHSEAYQGMKLLMQSSGRNSEPFAVILSSTTIEDLNNNIKKLVSQFPDIEQNTLLLVPQSLNVETNNSTYSQVDTQIINRVLKSKKINEEAGKTTIALLNALNSWKEGVLNYSDIEALSSTFFYSDTNLKQILLRIPIPPSLNIKQFWNQICSAAPAAMPANWSLLGEELSNAAYSDFKRLSLLMFSIVVILCWFAHRSLYLVSLNLFALVGALLGFLFLLRITHQSMTILSLLAVPLLIGLIVDYSIHIILGLVETKGNLKATYRHLAVPVILTGLTSVIGFGSPLSSQQPSLQNFGLVMDLGIISAVIFGLFVMPSFYPGASNGPSESLYRASVFNYGTWVAKIIGRKLSRGIGYFMGICYALTHFKKFETVRLNLQKTTSSPISKKIIIKVFSNYGLTFADYFCLNNYPKSEVLRWTTDYTGSEHLKSVYAAGKGGILITIHLGLFEYGNLLMEQEGYPTTVLTLAEPSQTLTKWRAEYRAKWKSETLEVGEDQFAFFKIIERIKENRFVTALIDRPTSGSQVAVDFPNGKIPFSTGPVLLSLLAGCPIVPAVIVATEKGNYHCNVYEPIKPVWLPSGRKETLEHFTRELSRVFVPIICKNKDQWYQFTPLS
jgi:predicted RND superfamily exporter protein/lauroyl/myristoyl acyltransferase